MISIVILARNEQDNIARALKSASFADEIIVIDDYSDDDTKKIAKSLGKKVYQRKLNGDFAAQRNFGMKKAVGEWILFVDADEVVSVELAEEIKKAVETSGINAYYIKRRDVWLGREMKYGELKKVRSRGLIRLVRKKSGKWCGRIHEVLKTSGKTSVLSNPLYHYPHPTVAEFLREINFYSTLRAEELFEKAKRTNFIEIVLYPLGKFILNYIIYLGMLDGARGFIYAFMMSFHSFLVRSKLYLKLKNVKQ